MSFFLLMGGASKQQTSSVPSPLLDFQLTGPTLPAGTALFRASIGTYDDINGRVAIAPNNQPRFEFTGATGIVILPPVANNNTFSTPTGVALTVAAPGVLANDTDPQAQAISVNSFDAVTAHGAVACNNDGSFTYTPVSGFVGSDTWTYDIKNASGVVSTSRGTVTMTVTAVVNPAATIAWNTPADGTTITGTAVTFAFTGTNLTGLSVTGPNGILPGTATVAANGLSATFVYNCTLDNDGTRSYTATGTNATSSASSGSRSFVVNNQQQVGSPTTGNTYDQTPLMTSPAVGPAPIFLPPGGKGGAWTPVLNLTFGTQTTGVAGPIQPGLLYWGDNGHRNQGGTYSTISYAQQLSDLKLVYGNVASSIPYRGGFENGLGTITADVNAALAAGIIPQVVIGAFPVFSNYANQAAAFAGGFADAQTLINQTPNCRLYEVGNEWSIYGSGSPPYDTHANDGHLASDWSGQVWFPFMVGYIAGANSAIRQLSPNAQIIGGVYPGWVTIGLPIAIGAALQNYNGTGNDWRWDFTVVHWYDDNDFGGNHMGTDLANFNGGLNLYTAFKAIGRPCFFSEFGSGSTVAGEAGSGVKIQAIMSNAKLHRATTATEPGVVGGNHYQLYDSDGEHQYAMSGAGVISGQGSAMQAFVVANGNGSTSGVSTLLTGPTITSLAPLGNYVVGCNNTGGPPTPNHYGNYGINAQIPASWNQLDKVIFVPGGSSTPRQNGITAGEQLSIGPNYLRSSLVATVSGNVGFGQVNSARFSPQLVPNPRVSGVDVIAETAVRMVGQTGQAFPFYWYAWWFAGQGYDSEWDTVETFGFNNSSPKGNINQNDPCELAHCDAPGPSVGSNVAQTLSFTTSSGSWQLNFDFRQFVTMQQVFYANGSWACYWSGTLSDGTTTTNKLVAQGTYTSTNPIGMICDNSWFGPSGNARPAAGTEPTTRFPFFYDYAYIRYWFR